MSYEEILALQESVGFVKIGVPPAIVDTFPQWVPRSEAAVSCSVCLETSDGAESFRCLPCRHRFHTACIDPWLAQNKLCPLCKTDVAELGEATQRRVHAMLGPKPA